MNSKNLKKTYIGTYEKFFLENQYVVSAPFVINWSGDILNNYSGVGIKQKIPLRMYIGYTKVAKKWVFVDKIYHLDINEYQFIESNAVEYAPYFTDINKLLEKKYGKMFPEGEWIKISLLSELPRGVGLWFGSILALLLSVVMHRNLGSFEPEDIEAIKDKEISSVVKDQYTVFRKIMVDALHFDKSVYGMVSISTKLATFFDGYYPIVSFSEDGEKTLLSEDEIVNRAYGFRLNTLFAGLRENPYVPIDYGLIYSWKPVLLEQIGGDKYKTNKNINKSIKSEFKKIFSGLFCNIHINRIPWFYKYLIAGEQDEFDSVYGKIMWSVSVRILHYMAKIYSESYEEDHMLQFLESLRKFRQADCVTRKSSKSYLKFIKNFLENFHWPQEYLSLSPNDTTIMGWSLLFAMPLEGFRKTLLTAVEKISLDFIGSKVIYLNWVDGIEYEWLKFEQDIQKWMYSDFLDSSSCILKTWDGKVRLGDCEKMINDHKQWILLDMVNNKIYMHGRKLTSSDIHSQTATVDILKVVINNIGKDVSNKDLPTSSYSKNKNDMQGKIIIPLMDLVQKELNKKLPLVCKWSLYDFYIKLNPSDIHIAIIDKLMNQKE